MTFQKYTALILLILSMNLVQNNSLAQEKKKRLDFAKTYFELGTTYHPSFTGKRLVNNQVTSFENSASLNPNLSWGGFHFWGKAEFNVTFPLSKLLLNESEETGYDFNQFVVTGARFYPWAVQEKKLRPFVGVSWSAYDYKQKAKDEDDFPLLSKNFELGLEAGLLYNFKSLAFRLNVNYFMDNSWKYPISKTAFETIKTPQYGINFGLIYTYESSGKPDGSEAWNEFPTLSPLSYKAKTFGDFFVGVGPSSSFSMENAEYNENNLVYLNPRPTSGLFFDFTLGYQFNKWNAFSAVTFRNPEFKREGFGTEQIIKKTSLALEANKFLTDYTGFAPYVGLSLAYDNIDYTEKEDGEVQEQLTSEKFNPGFSFGWDIVPGKTNEALILRTNLRWYPLADFNVSGEKFNFSQLEFNFIQVVFYPSRYIAGKK